MYAVCRRAGGIFLLAAAILSLEGCGSNPGPVRTHTESARPSVVRVGVTGTFADASIDIASARSYFKNRNIHLIFVRFSGDAEVVAALKAGRVDAADCPPGPVLYNALAAGARIRIVADNGMLQPGYGDGGLVVRTLLADSVTAPSNLQMRSVGYDPDAGVSPLIYLERLLRSSGLSLSDLKLVKIAPRKMAAALAGGTIDLAVVPEPFYSEGLLRGTFRVYKDLGEIYPGAETSVLCFSDSFASRTAIAERFTSACMAGAHAYDSAFAAGGDRATFFRILESSIHGIDSTMLSRMNVTLVRPDGRVNARTLRSDMEWYVAHGMVRHTFNLRAVIDNRFVDTALKNRLP